MHDAEAVDERGHGDQGAADQQRGLEAPPAPDQEGGEGDGEDDPDRLHSVAPHGATAIGRGSRSNRRAAAARAPRRSAKRPTTVGPDPHTSAWWAPDLARRGERLVDLRAQRARRGLEVVDDQLVGQVGGRGGDLAQPRGEVGRVARQALAVELAVDVGGRELERATGARARRRAPAGAAASGARPRPWPGSAAGAPGRRRRRPARPPISRRSASSSMPDARAASRSAAPASALPPAIPAATGMRFSIADAHRAAGPPGPLAKAPQRHGGEVLALHPGADDAIHGRAQAAGLELDVVGQGDRLEDRSRARGARPRGLAHVEAEVDLGRRRRAAVRLTGPPLAARASGAAGTQRLRERAELLGREALGALVGGMAELRRAPRGRDRARRGRGRGSARASARAPCGGGRRRRARARAPRARAPGRCGPGRRAPSRRWGPDGRPCARSSGARGRRTRAGRARWGRRRPACPARRRSARRPRAGPWPPSA